MIDPETYRAAILRESRALADASNDLDVEVPSCPGWTQRRLLRHVGKVQEWAGNCIRADADADVGQPQGPPEGADPRRWLVEQSQSLVDEFAGTDLDTPTSTWAGQRTRSWWLRRIAHETAIHRWDGQVASAAPDPFPPDLAADGVAEFFGDCVAAFVDPARFSGPPVSLHLHATDTGDDTGEWFVEFGPDGVTIETEHRKGDLAIKATASDLFLLVWGRRNLDDNASFGEIETFGDPAVLDRWREGASL